MYTHPPTHTIVLSHTHCTDMYTHMQVVKRLILDNTYCQEQRYIYICLYIYIYIYTHTHKQTCRAGTGSSKATHRQEQQTR